MKRFWDRVSMKALVLLLLLAGGALIVQSQTTGGTSREEYGAPNVGFSTDVIFCGQQAANGTIYMSPVSGFPGGALYDFGIGVAADLSYSIGGLGCDAEDNATEPTADEVLYADNAFRVLGMVCKVSSSGANGVVLNLRDDAASLTPNITITIPTTKTTGSTAEFTTINIAAGSAIGLRVINTEDLSLQDAWCIAKFLIVP